MLKENDKAPEFSLESDSLGTISLKGLRGKRVVLYFYPKDSTPGCTREAVAFSEARKHFDKANTVVLGVSKDSVRSHGSFREKFDLSVALLSDPDLKVHRAFGAFGEKMMYGKKVQGTIRSTFVIDEAGKIVKVFPNVKVDGHADEVLAVLGGATPPSAKAKTATKSAAKTSTKTATKTTAKTGAKTGAKTASKTAAKNTAKTSAKTASKTAVKSVGKPSGKGPTRTLTPKATSSRAAGRR